MFEVDKRFVVISMVLKALFASFVAIWVGMEAKKIEKFMEKIDFKSLPQQGVDAYHSLEKQVVVFNDITLYAAIAAVLFFSIAIIVAAFGRTPEKY